MLKNLFFAACFILTTASCTKEQLNLLEHIKGDAETETTDRTGASRSGVVLTFDDTAADGWYSLHQFLESTYNWKATFYVTRFGSLSSEKIQKLRSLQNEGHEIAAHGLKHLDAVKYINEHGAESYVQNEITPMLKLMQQNRLKVVNFAYPFGSRNAFTDSLLLKHFISVRGTTYRKQAPDVKDLKCYYSFDKQRLVYGLGIDTIYKNPVSYIQSVLQYAKDNNKVVVLYGHKPMPVATEGEYQTSYSTVEAICKFVKDNNMKFYTMRDLYRSW